MFARRRNLLHKHSQNGAHLVARAKPATVVPNLTSNTILASPTPSSDPNQSGNDNPLTSLPLLQTTDTTPTPSSNTTPSLPTASPSSPSASASPSSSPSSTSQTSASSSNPKLLTSTSTASSTDSTSLSVASSSSVYVFSGTTPVGSGVTYTPASIVSPTSSASPGSSGATHVGAVVGGVAGTLAGIAALGLLLIWCMRRQRSRDIDDFDAQAFKRQSTVLVDDPAEPSRSRNLRPPTMIEHHNASPALAAQVGYGGQNFYGNYGGYSQQPSYAPPEMIQPISSPPPQTYAAPSMGFSGYDPQHQIARHPSNVRRAPYDVQPQLARQPSNATYLTRQGPATPPGSVDPNAQYIDLNRSSVSPYQAAQYADISRQLGSTDPNAQAPHETLDLPADPLPSPFDDPPETTPVPSTSPNANMSYPTNMATPRQVATGNATEHYQRPTTVYGESDAYAGI